MATTALDNEDAATDITAIASHLFHWARKDPKLKVKCDKSLPPTAIPSSMLSGAKMKAILAK